MATVLSTMAEAAAPMSCSEEVLVAAMLLLNLRHHDREQMAARVLCELSTQGNPTPREISLSSDEEATTTTDSDATISEVSSSCDGYGRQQQQHQSYSEANDDEVGNQQPKQRQTATLMTKSRSGRTIKAPGWKSQFG